MDDEGTDSAALADVAEAPEEGDFGNSLRNVGTELDAVSLMLGDARIQIPDLRTKKRILSSSEWWATSAREHSMPS